MSMILNQDFPSGDPGIDTVSGGLKIGDNVVWRTESLALYRRCCRALAVQGREYGMAMVYFRFANHPPLFALEQDDQGGWMVVGEFSHAVEVIQTHPERGFEDFITQIHRVISRKGEGGIYFFDSLSDLQNIYYSDRMIGSFFRLTCPYLRRLKTIAYFCLDWFVHSNHALTPIRRTTQLWIDGFVHRGQFYLQPIKTLGGKGGLYRWARRSSEEVGISGDPGDDSEGPDRGDSAAVPVQNSAEQSAVRSALGWQGVPSAAYRQVDVWDSVFLRLKDLLQAGESPKNTESAPQGGGPSTLDTEEQIRELHRITTRMMLTNDPSMEELALAEVSPRDIVSIWQRMVGTGFIGGKALGMLLARAILRNARSRIQDYLEEHDSFYIGSDVFYTFLVDNDCWWDRQDQRSPEYYLRKNESLAQRILQGSFPQDVVNAFQDLLEYFAGSPIIVRSSSLLEDNFGNAFAGKYESIFCANQGSLPDRLEEFLNAVRRIYAGTMSREALEYRRDRGVLEKDEQMALLVQRVSGTRRGDIFYPDLAGTVLSWNPYVWHQDIDPGTGMARMVIGLGTRAVEQVGDDHPWIVSLGSPHRRLEEGRKRQHQQMMDCINLDLGRFETRSIALELLPPRLVRRDWRRRRVLREMGLPESQAGEVSLDAILSSRKDTLIPLLREAAARLSRAYGVQVELEFAAQWGPGQENPPENGSTPEQAQADDLPDSLRINLLQCRPFQLRLPAGESLSRPELVKHDPRIIIHAKGPVIGVGRSMAISHIIYVDPQGYSRLDEGRRYALGQAIGRLMHGLPAGHTTLLLGPGRWGTSTPAMGVPVSFRDIKGASVIAEMDWMHEGLSPELSLGTHFFHEMVEADLLFIGLRRSDKDCVINLEWFREQMVGCRDGDDGLGGFECLYCLPCGSQPRGIVLFADPIGQEVLLYQDQPPS